MLSKVIRNLKGHIMNKLLAALFVGVLGFSFNAAADGKSAFGASGHSDRQTSGEGRKTTHGPFAVDRDEEQRQEKGRRNSENHGHKKTRGAYDNNRYDNDRQEEHNRHEDHDSHQEGEGRNHPDGQGEQDTHNHRGYHDE
jgi:hypothetical protein